MPKKNPRKTDPVNPARTPAGSQHEHAHETEAANDAASVSTGYPTAYELLAREFPLPEDVDFFRVNTEETNQVGKVGGELVDLKNGDLAIVKEGRVDALVFYNAGTRIEDPIAECSLKELDALAQGRVPLIE